MALQVPDHVAELLECSYDGNDDFNRRVFTAALWFVGHSVSEDDYVDYVSSSDIGLSYPRKDLGKRLAKTYADAEEKFDPALAGGSVPPGFADEMTLLYKAVDSEPKFPNKKLVLALIQHSLNTGYNPVHASARQLAALTGGSVPVTARSMNRLAASACGCRLVTRVTYDGVYGHSRLWHINTEYQPDKGYICTCKNICNPPADPETRFREFVEPLPHGTELTVTRIASELSVTRPVAKRLLEQHTDEFFGGGCFEGDRKNRIPAKWWREPPKKFFLDQQKAPT